MIIYENNIVAYIDLSENRTYTADVIKNYAKRNRLKVQAGVTDAKTLLIFNQEGEDFLLICGISPNKINQQFKNDGFLMI